MIVSEIRLRFNKFATMKIKSYKDGNQVKKYVSTGKEKKAIAGTAIMTGIQGLMSLGTGIADYNRGFEEAKKRTDEINRLKATAPSLETPTVFKQAVKDAYDRSLLESQQREITKQLGTSVGALQQAGGRALLGGIGAATQQAALMGERAAQSQAQTQLGALSQLGQAELSTQRLRENRYQRELAAQREMRAQAEAGAGAGLGSAIGGLTSAGIVGAGLGGAFGGDIKDAMLKDYSKAEKGAVVKTKGEFSHEKNPIDLVQNGEKVGEATGGEYIFNPEQSRKMNELAKKATEGGSKSQKANAMQKLAKFVRTTLKRFEKDLG